MTEQTLVKNERDQATEILTCGRISHAVWFMAWPTIINSVVHMAYGIINRAFLGHTQTDTSRALAAIGVAGVVLMVQQAMMFGISAAASALSARFLGAEDRQNAQEAVGQSILLSAIAAAVSCVPIAIFATSIVRFAGARPDVVPYAADYLRIITIFAQLPMFVRMTMQSALRSAGDSRSPLYSSIVIVTLNVFFDWLFIFGHGPVRIPLLGWTTAAIPAMGVHGAAVATCIAHGAALVVISIFLYRSILGGAFKHLVPHPAWYAKILKIAWPAILQETIWATAFAAFIKVLGLLPDATTAQAALTVAIAIESLAFMPGVAYGIAATPLVGQNLGAEKPERAEHCAWVATGHAVGIMSVIAIVFLVFPRQIAEAFTNKEAVIRHIVTYLRINGVTEPFLAVAIVLTGALRGAGDTLGPMLIEAGSSYALRLPLAFYLAKTAGLGVTGAWIAMALSTVVYGVVVAVWFRRGRWKHIKLHAV